MWNVMWGATRDVVRKVIRDAVGNTARDAVRKISRDVIRKISRDVVRDILCDVVRDILRRLRGAARSRRAGCSRPFFPALPVFFALGADSPRSYAM